MLIVTTHKNTDFDGFASVIAATILFPDAVAVLPKHLNPNVKAFLSIHKELFLTHTAADVDLKAVDRLIVVDVNSWSRLDRMEPLKNRKELEILLWDHHIEQGSIHASSSCIEETPRSSTTPSTWSTPHARATASRLEKRSSTSVSRPLAASTRSNPPAIAL